MRRALILLIVFGLVGLVRPLGAAGYGSQALLSFGVLILAAYTIGEIAKANHVPKIVGYLVAGVVFGPFGVQTVSSDALYRLTPISDLAIGLIAFLAGAELRFREVRAHGITFLKLMSVELVIGLAVLAGLVYGARDIIPFLSDASAAEAAAFAILFASIAIVHSPAVTMALLTESDARGPVARTTLGVVLLADVVVVLLFTGALAVARTLVPDSGAGAASVGMVAWEILGAMLIGAAIGLAVTLYLRFIGEDLLLFAILVALLGTEVARLAHVEVLLTLLTAGFVTENASRHNRGERLRHAMERSAAPIFVVFFALAGAKIDIGGVGALALVVVPLAVFRGASIWAGIQIGGRWAGVPARERRYVWMGLISQAGVAIGLATIVADSFPRFGNELRALLLALVAINETVGPILFRRALIASGESVESAQTGDLIPAPAAARDA